MRTRGGILVIGAAALIGLLTGCASSIAPTSTASSEPSPLPSATAEASAAELEAQQRADMWLETTPVPPGAVRSEKSTSDKFAMSFQGWVCTPTLTATGYWSVEGMSTVEALNWMKEHPTPGLVPNFPAPLTDEGGYDNVTTGVTPGGDSFEGIAFTYVTTPEGSAIRAEVGATPVDAVCPTPPGGGSWGRPGEG